MPTTPITSSCTFFSKIPKDLRYIILDYCDFPQLLDQFNQQKDQKEKSGSFEVREDIASRSLSLLDKFLNVIFKEGSSVRRIERVAKGNYQEQL